MPSAAEGGVSRHARSLEMSLLSQMVRSPLDTIAARSLGSLDTRGPRPHTRDDRGKCCIDPSPSRSCRVPRVAWCIEARTKPGNELAVADSPQPLDTIATRSLGSLDTLGPRPRARDDRGEFVLIHPHPVYSECRANRMDT